MALIVQPMMARAQDAETPPSGEENETPARETPNFFKPDTAQPTQSATPAPAAPTATSASSAGTEQEDAEPRGLALGRFARFPFRLSASVTGGYDDNVVTTSSQGVGSGFIGSSAQINYKFGDPRTNLTLAAGAGVTYYFDRTAAPTPTPIPLPFPTPPPPPPPTFQSYDISLQLGLSVSHKMTQRLTLASDINASYQTQPIFSTNVSTSRRSGNYFYSTDRFGGTYQWLPRFISSFDYFLTVVRYDSNEIAQFQDRIEQVFATQFSFAVWPNTEVFGEYRFGIVSYEEGPFDSTSHFLLGGLKHKFDPHFDIVARGGIELRSFANLNGNLNEPYFDGSLNYAVGRSTISWLNHFSLEETGQAGLQSRTTFRTGLQIAHKVSPRISPSVAFYFIHDDYPPGPRPPRILPPPFPRPEGTPGFTENTLDLTLGLRYDINRSIAVSVAYSRTEFMSDFVDREYSRNRYYGSFNLTF